MLQSTYDVVKPIICKPELKALIKQTHGLEINVRKFPITYGVQYGKLQIKVRKLINIAKRSYHKS